MDEDQKININEKDIDDTTFTEADYFFTSISGKLRRTTISKMISFFKEKIGISSQITVDDDLSDTSTNPVQNKVVNEKISELKSDIEQLKQNGAGAGTGLSTEAINKLEEVGNYLAYTTADGGSKWTELISILRNGSSGGGSGETEVTLSSISATYTGGDVEEGTALSDLTGITVTATYSDGTTKTVTGYTLSGEILEGESTITVSYDGKTTTFTVTGVAEDTPEPLYGIYWPPKGAVTDWSNHTWDGVENFVYSGNTGIYIDGGFPQAIFIRLDKLQGTVYIRTLTNNQYGSVTNAYKVYANSDGEFSTGGFTEVVPTVTRSLGTMVVNDVTYYFVLFKFEIPSGQTGYFASAQNSANNGYFISDDKIAINEEYKPYYTLFTSNPTDRITEPATEVN